MESENRFWLTLWLGLSIAVCVIVGLSLNYCLKTNKLMVDAGYTQSTLLGKNAAYWVKTAPKVDEIKQ